MTTPAGILPSLSAIIAQPNGQILVGGFAEGVNRQTPGQTILVRYNSNGSLDTTFGTGGIAEVVSKAVSPIALAELSDGSYLAEGGVDGTSVVEFSSTGVLQSKVTPGKLEAGTLAGASCCAPVLFQPNGDYVVAQVGSGPGSGEQGVKGEDGQRSMVQVSRFTETGAAHGVSPAFGFGGSDDSMGSARS